jgi:hypothetical protein
MNLKQRIAKLKREVTPPEENPVVMVQVSGNPDAGRVGPMVSEREGLVGGEYFAASPDETTQQFHARLKAHYRQTKARGCVVLGHPGNAAPPAEPIFNADGKLRLLN